MFASMLHIEHTKLYRRKLLWIVWALLGGLLTLILSALFVAHATHLVSGSEASGVAAMLTWPQSLVMGLNFMTNQAFGALIVILVVSVVAAQEYAWGTYALWLRQGVSRTTVLAAKIAALIGATALTVGLALLFAAIPSGIFTVILNGTAGLGQVDWLQVVLGIGRTTYTLLPYMALAFFIAIRTRSMIAGAGIVIAYTLLVEGMITQIVGLVIGGLPAKLVAFLPGSLAMAVNELNRVIAGTLPPEAQGNVVASMSEHLLPPGFAALGIALYTLLFFGLAFRAFRRQDITT